MIKGANWDLLATAAIFMWLSFVYGQKDREWKLLVQSHFHAGGRHFDRYEIEQSNGTRVITFFDITESFGKFSPPAISSARERKDTPGDSRLPE